MKLLEKKNISIIGGAGHVGLPLGLVFANKNFNVSLVDTNKKNLELIKSGQLPFSELGGKKLLEKALKKNRLFLTDKLNYLKYSKFIIVSTGTPINKKFNPQKKKFISFFKKMTPYLKKNHIIIIRSSIYPGVCKEIYNIIKKKCKNISYCPERIAEGKAITELPKLTQIISGINIKAIAESSKLFKKITKKIIVSKIIEAELAKLFSNAYRYIHFSISNQFYMMAEKYNLNFNKLRKIMSIGYSRNHTIPLSGFTAGPCLLKDTMQLSSFYNHNFSLGNCAKDINEGFPNFIVNQLIQKYSIKNKTIGVLGLTFKPNVDDIRDSLAIKLLKILRHKKIKTLQSDEYYFSTKNVEKNFLIKNSDLIILGAPHSVYRTLNISKKKLIDVWGFFDK